MKRKFALTFISLATMILMTQVLYAFPQFGKGFKKLYLETTSDKFKQAVSAAKCNLCHDPTKKTDKGKSSKKFKNAYGQALDKLLGKKDKKNKEKIEQALKDVEQEKAPDSEETFGERLRGGKLPIDP
jgi:hypothetical protein